LAAPGVLPRSQDVATSGGADPDLLPGGGNGQRLQPRQLLRRTDAPPARVEEGKAATGAAPPVARARLRGVAQLCSAGRCRTIVQQRAQPAPPGLPPCGGSPPPSSTGAGTRQHRSLAAAHLFFCWL